MFDGFESPMTRPEVTRAETGGEATEQLFTIITGHHSSNQQLLRSDQHTPTTRLNSFSVRPV
jgi:hypothetical protein